MRIFLTSSLFLQEDVWMDLVELDSVKYGEPYKARVMLEVRKIQSGIESDE